MIMRAVILVALSLVACKQDKQPAGTSAAAASVNVPANTVAHVAPPADLKKPPADAIKTASGLVYKKLVVNDGGTPVKRNDTVLINYTGWKQSTGETFFSTKQQDRAWPLNLAKAAPGFTEAMQLMRKGEKAILWVPPEIGHTDAPKDKETRVYEVEVFDVIPSPAVPPDVGAPPATAQALPGNIKYTVVRDGTGTEKPRYFDTVTFNYTAWDATGRMFDTTEMRARAMTLPPFRVARAFEQVLTAMTAGQRVRFWVDAKDMRYANQPLPGAPDGLLTYEVELLQIEKAPAAPPAPPPDVAKPPATGKKAGRGVIYKWLKQGPEGPTPKPTDKVKITYTAWTTDGRLIDSSVLKGGPVETALNDGIAGLTDGVPVLTVGSRARFWIPEELANKGAPGKPQGMLVYDIELHEIISPPDPHKKLPAPSDVAAPPKDAKKTNKGVFYKILKPGNGPKPTAKDRVKVHYTGWQTDGTMFDSSVTKGQPAEFSLEGVIEGWKDGIPMLSVGDKARLWIPEELAYRGGEPKGMLVFDVELLEIKSP